tara:strand:+ start:3769 stop:4479 length:711 start_codon:yes stop_codon:yes gene_type:complete
MKKNILIIIVLIALASCDNSKGISLTKLTGSPTYGKAKLRLNDFNENEKNEFSFEVENYELGIQTKNDFKYKLANSDKGQHIHLIVNNQPYSAHYSNNFQKKLEGGNNVVLAFLSRSHHESVKNPNAYIFTQIGDGKKIDLEKQYLFYSRPKGTYTGSDTEKLLLDFYLVNTSISAKGNKVRVTIQDTEFLVDEWAPYIIEGLPKGEISIKLELLNSYGELIENPFNPSIRKVILK